MTPLSCNMCIILPQCFAHEAVITHVCVCVVTMYGNHLHNHVGNTSGVLWSTQPVRLSMFHITMYRLMYQLVVHSVGVWFIAFCNTVYPRSCVHYIHVHTMHHKCRFGGGCKGGPLILQLGVPPHNCNISISKLRVPLKGVLKGALKGALKGLH